MRGLSIEERASLCSKESIGGFDPQPRKIIARFLWELEKEISFIVLSKFGAAAANCLDYDEQERLDAIGREIIREIQKLCQGVKDGYTEG